MVAFIGALGIFKLQFDESKKQGLNPLVDDYEENYNELKESQRLLTIGLKKIVIISLFDVAMALVAIPLIPYFNYKLIGPIYLGTNISLSVWVLLLLYPTIENILRLTPQK